MKTEIQELKDAVAAAAAADDSGGDSEDDEEDGSEEEVEVEVEDEDEEEDGSEEDEEEEEKKMRLLLAKTKYQGKALFKHPPLRDWLDNRNRDALLFVCLLLNKNIDAGFLFENKEDEEEEKKDATTFIRSVVYFDSLLRCVKKGRSIEGNTKEMQGIEAGRMKAGGFSSLILSLSHLSLTSLSPLSLHLSVSQHLPFD
jgi:hypothetical protein